jgi:Ca2+-binding RTX toxin-like protein
LNGAEGRDLLIGGSGSDALDGGGGSDRLIGNAGNDRLNGGPGVDELTGGPGFNTFVFNAALRSSNVDTIRDFRPFFDTIKLDNAVFGGLPTGVLSAAAFHVGTKAVDDDQRIIYNDATGQLFFDKDGAAGARQIQFASIAGSPDNITAGDFFVI